MKFDFNAPANTEAEASEKWPECAIFVEVDGGWAAFETAQEYEMWKNQE